MNFSSLLWGFSDGWIMCRRNLKHIFRNPESLFVSILLPIVLMLMFVYVFGGAIQIGTEYVNYVVPGIIIICVGYGSSMTAVSVCQDKVGGLFDRLRSMDIHPSALLVGHVIGSYVRSIISTTLVFIVAALAGFRPEAGFIEWIGVLAFLSLFMLSISWLSVIFGLIAVSIETASAFTFFLMFLPYVSSAFVPTETMPSWLHFVAENQPMTPLIETIRGYFIGAPIDSNALLSIAWFGSLLVLSVIGAVVVFNRHNRK